MPTGPRTREALRNLFKFVGEKIRGGPSLPTATSRS